MGQKRKIQKGGGAVMGLVTGGIFIVLGVFVLCGDLWHIPV